MKKGSIRFMLVWVLLALAAAGCTQGDEAGAKKTVAAESESVEPVADEISFRNWREALPAVKKHTIIGNVSIAEFPMKSFDALRKVWLYLPPNYDSSDTEFPVLYMHDAQNLFNDSTSFMGEWGIDETMEQLYTKNPALGMIVVAIENGGDNRYLEYTPSNYGAKYVDFLVNELKPYIDNHYRTKSDPRHTYISGSSLGGYISVYAGLKNPDVFGNVIAFSSVFEIGRNSFFEYVRGLSAANYKDSRFYLDIGEMEEEQFINVVQDNETMFQYLTDKDIPADRRKLVIDPDGVHNELDWRERFPAALEWILKAD
ncbi:hypothetical protein PAECIP111893_00927 [Paenibacillus plantiphilus]|uniref:Esterase n=1 Tax=Paenibacillus plantiphilus TaxID=2905650 RepID=A0ABN8G304_9BACL|nr:alpha/beta hydrolase-fold protein [Paenibacillus plantiphilus]CAH1197737.1 hypothetical protein PAECIP111893_00927 [Paenibacillus plantiphilus]